MNLQRGIRQINSASSIILNQSRRLSHFGPSSATPFVEHARSAWPEVHAPSNAPEIILPKKTVPDSALKFTLRATFDHGAAIHYPHLKFHPADFKVKMSVSIRYNIISLMQ